MRDRRQRETELVDCWRQKARGMRRGEWLVGERGGASTRTESRTPEHRPTAGSLNARSLRYFLRLR